MAYPTICDPCLDGKHGACWDDDEDSEWNQKRRENNALPPEDRLVGGAFCICTHEDPARDDAWRQQVRAAARTARTARVSSDKT